MKRSSAVETGPRQCWGPMGRGLAAEEVLKNAVDAEHAGHLALQAVLERAHAAEEAAAAGSGPAAWPGPLRNWGWRRRSSDG